MYVYSLGVFFFAEQCLQWHHVPVVQSELHLGLVTSNFSDDLTSFLDMNSGTI